MTRRLAASALAVLCAVGAIWFTSVLPHRPAGGVALAASRTYTVTVDRVSAIRHLRPLRRVITGQTQVMRLYDDMMRVPAKPRPWIYMCPMDVGVSYRLTFDLGGRIVNAHADASGCRFIHLAKNRVLWASGTQGDTFWSDLGQILRLTPEELRSGS